MDRASLPRKTNISSCALDVKRNFDLAAHQSLRRNKPMLNNAALSLGQFAGLIARVLLFAALVAFALDWGDNDIRQQRSEREGE